MEETASNQASLLKEIFLEALDRTDMQERTGFLDAACGEDAALRQRVEELLQEEESVGGFLERQVWSTAGDPQGDPSHGEPVSAALTEQIGDRVGKYELVSKLGEGGCGVVYVARQLEPLCRDVALKVIRVGTNSRQVIARFEAERQTLALMDHPNIAKVFDAGTTQAGRPFCVMELIKGKKLTEHCNQNQLGIRERLRLFMQVCLGVQHAHQKGVIHRDIKPSNILVADHDGQAVPKIIDFGIAKAIHQALPTHEKRAGSGHLLGTPAYMSPEQASACGDVDTRSDIYSLGVILHELLTGWAPPSGPALFERGLVPTREPDSAEPPVLPSRYLCSLSKSDADHIARQRGQSARRLVTAIRGDLDCIVTKALERDRTRRYPSANAFAQDIESYLANEPVRAHPPSQLYRFSKLTRRHRPAFIALTGVALVLLLSAGLSAWLALRATNAETEARLSGSMEAQLRREAVRARARAETQADLAQLNEYVADINLAQQSLESGNYGRAIQLLKKQLPEQRQRDLRGFEWRYLWEFARGDDHVPFPAQESSVRTLTVSPLGQWLAIGTDNRLALWDLRSQALLRNFPKRVIAAAFCGPDRELAFSTPGAVTIVDLTSGSETNLPCGDGGALTVSKDGSRLASAGRDGVRVWDTQTWTLQSFLPQAAGPMAFAPDNTLLATGGRDGITLWGLSNLTATVVLKNSRDIFRPRRWDQLGSAMTFACDGRYLVAPRNLASERGLFVLGIWDAQSGEEVAVLPHDPDHPEHTGAIAGLALSPDGHTLATASMDHSIRLWDLDSQRVLRVLHGHLSEVWSAAFSPDGASLFTGAKDGSVDLWAIPPRPKSDLLEGPYLPLAFSMGSQRLAALDEEHGRLLFINPTTKQIEKEFSVERRSLRSPARFALSADFKILASAHRNHVSLYNTLSGQKVELQAGEAPIFELALSPDGTQLVTGGFGGTFEWRDLATHANKIFLENDVRRALFSPDGTTLLLLAGEDRAELWDVADRRLRTVLTPESRFGLAAAFSPKRHLLAISSDPLSSEQTINVWDVRTGALLGACIGHKQGITALSFSADGRTLASASHDGTLKFWNIATLQQLTSFTVPGDAYNPLFSPDGTFLVFGQSIRPKGIRFYSAPLPLETDLASQNIVRP